MSALRPFALVATEDQWRRAAHQETALVPGTSVVELASLDGEPDDVALGQAPSPAGLAFDPWCRLYHSLPEEGRVERVLWAAKDPSATALDLLVPGVASPAGDFRPVEENPAPGMPLGLAVDEDARLFVADPLEPGVLVYDLWDRRLLRRVRLAARGAGPRPLDLATDGQTVWVALDSAPGLAALQARTGPRLLSTPPGVEAISRIAHCSRDALWLLTDAGADDARVVPLARPEDAFQVPLATDLEFQEPGLLVVARLPGQDFLRFAVAPGSRELAAPLKARGYDGRGIVRTPDGRIGFWTTGGFRHAVLARRRYVRRGRVVTFRLDSGEFQTVWGRVFVDACVPRGTDLRVYSITADQPPQGAAELPRTPPANTEAMTIRRPDLSPPMPASSLVPGDDVLGARLHRRETGLEVPWVRRAPDDPFETYEAPVLAGPGRYLWIVLDLLGDSLSTPRVKAVRAEHPSHDLLRRLPKLYSRDGPAADFLRRYLAPLEGTLQEIDARALARRALLNPKSAPAEVLPWLAGFLGLVLDERWPVGVRRTLIAEAAWLFRFRGTVPGLTRFLEIVLGRRPLVIEHFRVRGLGGAYIGEGPLESRAILGAGFRVGGAVGTNPGTSGEAVAGTEGTEDAFETHAHRFSLVVAGSLDTEEREMLDHLLDVHRPAHTLYDLCTVDAGMRVGVALYAGLTSVVGRTGGFAPLRVGGSLLGRRDVVGRPVAGTRPGSSRLGEDSRVG